MPPDDHRPLRAALDPISSPYFAQLSSAAGIAKEVIMGGFGGTEYRKSESMRILSDRAYLLALNLLLSSAE
jgi:division protein 1